MTRYLIRRVLFMVFVLWVVSILTFLIFVKLPPGKITGVGRWAVGNSKGDYFAVTRRCRHLYADLASSATLLSVSASLEEPPGALADAVEAALAQRSLLGKSAA